MNDIRIFADQWKEVINLFTTGINLLLTVAVVIATIISTYLSRRALKESIDARHASIRPLIQLYADQPNVELRNGRRYFTCNISIKNIGRGPAYNLRVSQTLHTMRHGETMLGGVQPYSSAAVTFQPGDFMDCVFDYPLDNQDLKCGNIYEVSFSLLAESVDGEGRAVESSKKWSLHHIEELNSYNFGYYYELGILARGILGFLKVCRKRS